MKMEGTKIMRKSRVVSRSDMDSVKRARKRDDRRALDVLFEAQRCWSDMERFRRERERNKRYTYGEQWKDIVNVEGQTMTEEEYIKSQGNVP